MCYEKPEGAMPCLRRLVTPERAEPASQSTLGFSGLVVRILISIAVLAISSTGLLVFQVIERWGVSWLGPGPGWASAEVSAI
jgi:hypothetical protein